MQNEDILILEVEDGFLVWILDELIKVPKEQVNPDGNLNKAQIYKNIYKIIRSKYEEK